MPESRDTRSPIILILTINTGTTRCFAKRNEEQRE